MQPREDTVVASAMRFTFIASRANIDLVGGFQGRMHEILEHRGSGDSSRLQTLLYSMQDRYSELDVVASILPRCPR